MGTRADFYVGRGEKAEWLGSIAWDGYPEGIDAAVLVATSEDGFRKAVAEFFSKRKDVSLPKDGWPWPWEDSKTTDYTYAFDDGVWVACYGYSWYKAGKEEPEGGEPQCVFPNMKAIQKVVFDSSRSGIITVKENG